MGQCVISGDEGGGRGGGSRDGKDFLVLGKIALAGKGRPMGFFNKKKDFEKLLNSHQLVGYF